MQKVVEALGQKEHNSLLWKYNYFLLNTIPT